MLSKGIRDEEEGIQREHTPKQTQIRYVLLITSNFWCKDNLYIFAGQKKNNLKPSQTQAN